MQSRQVDALGLGLGVGRVACLVTATLLTPRLIPEGNPYFLTGWQAITAATPVAAIAALSTPHVTFTPMFIVCMIYLVIAATVLGISPHD